MFRPPVKVFTAEPLRVSVPVPSFVRPAEPSITVLMVFEVLFTVILPVPPRLILVPPESTMAPEADPKVMLCALT